MLSHVITLPPNEVVQVLQAIAGTPTGGAMACRFLQAKWYDLEAKIGAGSVNFAKVISAITQYGATKFDYDEVSQMISKDFIYFFIIQFNVDFNFVLLSFLCVNSVVEVIGASIR